MAYQSLFDPKQTAICAELTKMCQRDNPRACNAYYNLCVMENETVASKKLHLNTTHRDVKKTQKVKSLTKSEGKVSVTYVASGALIVSLIFFMSFNSKKIK